jgi:transmembrane sensor
MDEKQLIKLIERYLAGQCSEEEKTEVEQWYETFEQQQRLFLNGDAQKMEDSAERSLKAIQKKLPGNQVNHLKPNLEEPISKPKSYAIKRFPFWAAAACVLLCLSAVIGLYFKQTHAPEKYTVLSAGVGKVKYWKLPDGSSIWLNAGSIMKLPTNFNNEKREVYLEGEAFFNVAKQVDKPFIIHAGNLRTQVLGTAFSVSAYPDATLNTVTVVNGKVQVSDTSQVLGNLTADRKMEYSNSSGKHIIATTDAAKEMSWKAQQLVFTDLPMADIALRLQHWYGYQFYFKRQELKNVRFTASFKNTINLQHLLTIMQGVSHVNYQLDHKAKTVIFL